MDNTMKEEARAQGQGGGKRLAGMAYALRDVRQACTLYRPHRSGSLIYTDRYLYRRPGCHKAVPATVTYVTRVRVAVRAPAACLPAPQLGSLAQPQQSKSVPSIAVPITLVVFDAIMTPRPPFLMSLMSAGAGKQGKTGDGICLGWLLKYGQLRFVGVVGRQGSFHTHSSCAGVRPCCQFVEDQLMAWSHLLRDGKRLRIDISFIYKEATQPVAVRTQQRKVSRTVTL